ncbi:hypothetical protein OROGR_029384 [Orobanche gracilis]
MCSETKRKRKRKREEDVLFSVNNLELIQPTASPSSSDHCVRRRGRLRKTSRTDNSISATNGIILAASVSAAIANGDVPTALINEESAVARVLPAMDAVVKVFCVHTEPNFSLPWQRKQQYSSSSSGFVIKGRRVLTNAHSVEHFTQVKLMKRGSDTKYVATVLAIGTECDIVSTKMSPFQPLYGREPPQLLHGTTIPSGLDAMNELQSERDGLLSDLKANLLKSQDMMRKYVNQHRRDVAYQVGDQVFLKLQPYRRRSLAKKLNEKLSPRFYGPFVVTAKVGEVTYQLDLPPYSRIHTVFHLSLLKKAVGTDMQAQSLPGALNEDHELLVEPQEVLAVRETTRGFIEVLVSWQTLPPCEDSWESAARFHEAFPSFPLEDKVGLVGGVLMRVLDLSHTNL